MIGTVCRDRPLLLKCLLKLKEIIFSDIQTPGSLQKFMKMYLLFYTDLRFRYFLFTVFHKDC